MNRLKQATIVLLTAFLVTLAGNALAALTPTWSNATTDVENSDFDEGELTFERLTGNCLQFVNAGEGYFHNHGNGASLKIDARIDNVWTPVFTQNVGDEDFALIRIEGVPLPEGFVDGVRLYSSQPVEQAFHSINSEMQFDIGSPNRCGPAPIPASSPLFTTILVLSLAGFGLFFSRRRRVTVA